MSKLVCQTRILVRDVQLHVRPGHLFKSAVVVRTVQHQFSQLVVVFGAHFIFEEGGEPSVPWHHGFFGGGGGGWLGGGGFGAGDGSGGGGGLDGVGAEQGGGSEHGLVCLEERERDGSVAVVVQRWRCVLGGQGRRKTLIVLILTNCLSPK